MVLKGNYENGLQKGIAKLTGSVPVHNIHSNSRLIYENLHIQHTLINHTPVLSAVQFPNLK